MSWLSDAAALRASRTPSVLVTLIARQGHAPREAGAKMLVTVDASYGSIGGGNLEAGAVARAREMLTASAGDEKTLDTPEIMEFRLNDKVAYDHGRQCCGGTVSVLLEPQPVPPAVVVFGCGHVGVELARILSRQDADLWFYDSRPEQVTALAEQVADSPATVRVEHTMLPESEVEDIPDGADVLVMTHDHAEDLHLCEALLSRLRDPEGQGTLGSVGLIGSSAKWTRFRKKLGDDGFSEDEISGIQCPVGIAGLGGSHPATIAVSIAADLLSRG